MASDNEASCESDPNFAVICAFMEKFGVICGLTDFDFLVLQEMLENTQEVSQDLIDLHIKLLRKSKKSVSNGRWEKAIIKFCHGFCVQDAWEIERFGYKKARLSSKLRVLKELLEMQFDLNSKFKAIINQMSAEELRSQPLGKDKSGQVYWFHSDSNCQIRVYKEDPDEETWTLIARDRDGLASLINELSDGDSKVSSESTINEDSNSLAEKPIIDTGQVESNSSDSKKSIEESENSNEAKRDDSETKVQPVDEETNQPIELKRRREDDGDDEEQSAKRSKSEKINLEPKIEEVGEAVEEPLMLVKGQGSGCENEGVYTENPIVGDEIEEPVMFFVGAGSGQDCQTGNEEKSPKKPEAADDNTQTGEVLSTVKTSGASNVSINDKSDLKNCVSNPSDGSSEDVPTSPVKNPYKLGTIIDTKTDNKFFNAVKSPTKKSRWDVETLPKPDEPETVVTGKVKELVGKWEQIGDEKPKSEQVEGTVPKKTMFFFGPSCLQFKPAVSPVPCSATVGFGKVPQVETGFDAKKTTSNSGNDGRELIPSNTKGDIGYRISDVAEQPASSTTSVEKESASKERQIFSNKASDSVDEVKESKNKTVDSADKTVRSENDSTPIDSKTALDEKNSGVSTKIETSTERPLGSNNPSSEETSKVKPLDEETKDQIESVVSLETSVTDKEPPPSLPLKLDKENRTENAIPLKSEAVGSLDDAKLDNNGREGTEAPALSSSTNVEDKSTSSKVETIPAERLAKLEGEVVTESDGKCDLELVKGSKKIKVADSGSRPDHSTNLLNTDGHLSRIDKEHAVASDLAQSSVLRKEDSKGSKSADEADGSKEISKTDERQTELEPVVEKECVKKYAYTLGDETTKEEATSVSKKETDLVESKSLVFTVNDVSADNQKLNTNHIPNALKSEAGPEVDNKAKLSSDVKISSGVKDSKDSVPHSQSIGPGPNEPRGVSEQEPVDLQLPESSFDIKTPESTSQQKLSSSCQQKTVDSQLTVGTKSTDVEKKPLVSESISEVRPVDSELLGRKSIDIQKKSVDSLLFIRTKASDPPVPKELAASFQSPLKLEPTAPLKAPKSFQPPEEKSVDPPQSSPIDISIPKETSETSKEGKPQMPPLQKPVGFLISDKASVDRQPKTSKPAEEKLDVSKLPLSEGIEQKASSSKSPQRKQIESLTCDHKITDPQLSLRLQDDPQLLKSTEEKSSVTHLNAEPKPINLKVSTASADHKPLEQKLIEGKGIGPNPIALGSPVEKTSDGAQLSVKEKVALHEASCEKKMDFQTPQDQSKLVGSKSTDSKTSTENIPPDPQPSVKAMLITPQPPREKDLQSLKGSEPKLINLVLAADSTSTDFKVSTKISVDLQEAVKPKPTVLQSSVEERLRPQSQGAEELKTVDSQLCVDPKATDSTVTTKKISDDLHQSVDSKLPVAQSSLDQSLGLQPQKSNEAKSVDSQLPIDVKTTDSEVSTVKVLSAQKSVKSKLTVADTSLEQSLKVKPQAIADPKLTVTSKPVDSRSTGSKAGSKTTIEKNVTNSQLFLKSQLIDAQASKEPIDSQVLLSVDPKSTEPKPVETQLTGEPKQSESQSVIDKKPRDSHSLKPLHSQLATESKTVDSYQAISSTPTVSKVVDLQKSVEPQLSKEPKPVDSPLLPKSCPLEPKVPVEEKIIKTQQPVDTKPVRSHVSLRSVRAVGSKVSIEKLPVSEKIKDLEKCADSATTEPNPVVSQLSKVSPEKSTDAIEPKATDPQRFEKSVSSSVGQHASNSKLSIESKPGDSQRSLRSKRIEKKQTSADAELIDSKHVQETIPEASQSIVEKPKLIDTPTTKRQDVEELVAKVDESVPKESKTVGTKLTESVVEDEEKPAPEELPPKKPGPKPRRKSANISEAEEKKPRVATRRSTRSSKTEIEPSDDKARDTANTSDVDAKVPESAALSDVRTVDITEVKVILTPVNPEVIMEKVQEAEREKEAEKGKKSKVGELVAPRRGRSRGVPSAEKEELEGDVSKKMKLSGDTQVEEVPKEVKAIRKTRNRFKESKETKVAVVILENTAIKTEAKVEKAVEKPEPGSTEAEVEVTPEGSAKQDALKTADSSKSGTIAKEAVETKLEPSKITETRQEEAVTEAEIEEVAVVSKPVDPIMVDSSSNSCDIVEGPDNDPLEISDQDTKDEEDVKPAVSLTSFSLDFNESPTPTPSITKRGLRKRGRDSPQNVEDTEATAGKRIKMRGKRTIDVKLRKSIEEQKKQELVSSDDDNKIEEDKDAEAKKEKADKSSDSEAKPKVSKKDSLNKNKRLLSNLGITLDQQSALNAISGVRQSRRIAQLKIKEEAERRKLEDDIYEHHKTKKKKSKKSEDKDYKTEKRKGEVEDGEDEAEEKVEKKKKRKKHRKPKKRFNLHDAWRSSSDSSSSAVEDEEEEMGDEEEDDDRLQYVSDHEFSPESDMEGDGEAQPLKRARTARKESEDEEVDDCPCQKCQKSDHPEWILLCDRCDNGWHCSCLRPPLLVIPEGDWFCPPCQHIRLIQKLQEKLHDYDLRLNKKEIEDRRKERLAYVGISLNSVLPAKDSDHVKESKRRNSKEDDSSSEESESESGSESGESESDSDEPIYQLRQRRQAHSYRFNDYDDLINSAIQDEMEAVKGAGNQGRGKDIATIVNAEKDEEEWKKGEGEEEQPEEPEPLPRIIPEDTEARPLGEDEATIKKRLIGQKKKHRKLNALDVSSGEDDGDSDFKGTSSESDDEFDDDLGSEDSDVLEGTRRRKNHDPVRRSTRARTSRYDADFIDDGDSDYDEEPRKKKKRSIWDESESEESDRSWGRRKKRPAARRPTTTPKKKSKKKKKNDDDSDAEVYRKKKPKIKFGLDGEDEGPGRRTRGKKINYIDALGSDSEEERVKRPPPRIESEEEYVANEEDELDEDDKVTDEEESGGEDGVPKPPKVQIQSFTDQRFTQALPEGVPTPKNPFGRPGHLDDVDSLEQMNRNLEEMDENEIGKMMEEEDYANKQLQLVALQIEREKKRKEREAKKLETIPPILEQELPKKRGRKPKGHFQFPPAMQDPVVGSVDSLLNSDNNDELSEPPGVSLPMFAELAATNESLDDPKKRRGRGRGKKSLEEAVAVLGSVRQQEAIQSGPFIPGQESNIEIAAPPQPFSQSQPTPSVITRMLQNKPGQPGYPVGSIRPKQFAAMPERDEDGSANLPPAAGTPHHSMSPHHGPPGQYMQGGMRPQMSSPYRQIPPNINHYPRSGPPPPHQIRNPVPQNLPPHIYHAHRSLDPSPSGGSAMNMSGHSSPSRVSSPAAGSPGPNKNDTPPPPYSRPPVGRFPMVNNPTPMTTAVPRHLHMHMQPPRPNMSPYHPNIPPSYHYGAFPQPPMGGAEDAMPPTVYQNSPYSEPFNEGQVNPSENSNSKSFDEESGGEFGGLVSYFSSQREDDLES